MKLIIPMAGMGKRMRPHTLSTPKPLLPIAGKSIVQRLVEDINNVCNNGIEEVCFITGRFGDDVDKKLKQIAESIGVKSSIFYQDQALGTAHALLCAKEKLSGPVIVAFADTLFRTDFKLDESQDGIIWVHKVQDPSAFGVVTLDQNNNIKEFVEKPEKFVSDLAIIGIYYFKDAAILNKELQYLIDNNIKDKGEYQLTSALENMKNKGLKFKPGQVSEWLDCGNKDATVYTNQRVLEMNKNKGLVSQTHKSTNSVIIEPCYIGENVQLINSVVGPYVSIGDNSIVEDSVVKNSIIQTNSKISRANVQNSMFGNYVEFSHPHLELSIGDYSTQYH
jgi:glucose-1-phosphate thymidylyltransferase